MTRDELLNHLRRELSNQAWSDLRPDTRLAELESELDALTERLGELRSDYNETTGEEQLRALDDLAASLSYLRIEIGHLFSDATRLANELRAALRQTRDGESVEQLAIRAESGSTGTDATAASSRENGSGEGADDTKSVRQKSLF